jgi:hypothetical protein
LFLFHYYQSNYGVALGYSAGQNSQGSAAIAIGYQSAQYLQNTGAIAIGTNAGYTGQGTNAIAIGTNAGYTGQPQNSILIGANANCTQQNTIVLNSSGSVINPATSGFYVSSINSTNTRTNFLIYEGGQIVANSGQAKSFIINHPYNINKYLVHVCLEGPEVGVYYRGKSEIINNESVIIELPEYVRNLAHDFTIQITPIHDPKNKLKEILTTTEVYDNKFEVYGPNTKFFWIVHGKRHDIEVEPDIETTQVKGNGPYKWI